MAKYAPAREDGLKPFVVAVSSWGRTHEVIEWAEKASQAAYQAKGRQMHTSARARRATPDDMERVEEHLRSLLAARGLRDKETG